MRIEDLDIDTPLYIADISERDGFYKRRDGLIGRQVQVYEVYHKEQIEGKWYYGVACHIDGIDGGIEIEGVPGLLEFYRVQFTDTKPKQKIQYEW